MKADYKNWMPKGMVAGTACGTVASFFLHLICKAVYVKRAGKVWNALNIGFLIPAIMLFPVTIWMILMYRAFSYNGKRQMSKQIIEGVASYVNIPDGGKGLDVGCGSGALTIACAKRNPKAQMTVIDRWGKEYASFSKTLCEDNANAEGVSNTYFEEGNPVGNS